MTTELPVDLPNLLYFVGKASFQAEFKKKRKLQVTELLEFADKKLEMLTELAAEKMTNEKKAVFAVETWILLIIFLIIGNKRGVSDYQFSDSMKDALRHLKKQGGFEK
ncbi:MAG: hypothetical protein ACTSUK_07240 [Promethearchaeota archaeon]